MRMQRSVLALCAILAFALAGRAEFLVTGAKVYTLANPKVAAEAGDASSRIVTFSVAPAKNLKTATSLCVCVFAPRAGTDVSLDGLVVAGGDFNWSFPQNGQSEYWTMKVAAKGGGLAGPLTIQRVSSAQMTKTGLQVRLKDLRSTGSFGEPVAFPTKGPLQIALAHARWSKEERTGLDEDAPRFEIVSNAVTIEP